MTGGGAFPAAAPITNLR